MTVVSLDFDRAGGHPALAADLEHAALLRDVPAPWHLAREQARVAAALAAGGFALATGHALALVRPLPFDSTHFGLPCADLQRIYLGRGTAPGEIDTLVDAVVRRARRSEIALLSARPLAGQVTAIQRLLHHGFLLVDTSVELGRLGGPNPPRPSELRLRDPEPGDAAALRRIARSFVDNRFHRDPNLAAGKAAALYARWADAARLGRHGRMIVAEVEGQVGGFCTYVPASTPDGVGLVGLVVIERRRRGGGIFAPLVSAAARAAGGRATVTSTQVTNAPALRAFAKLGLLPFGARQILHGWLRR